MTQQREPFPQPAGGTSRPAGWSEEFLRHRNGQGCPMCGNDFAADDIGWGILLHQGAVANAYLWRSGHLEGAELPAIKESRDRRHCPRNPCLTDRGGLSGTYGMFVTYARPPTSFRTTRS